VRDLWELRKPRAGYESLYLTATSPDGTRALWLRHTWLNGEPQLWVTWWGPALVQARGPGEAELTREGSRGVLDGHTWDLTWTASADPVPYLPGLLYDRPWPRSNGVALVPHGTVAGSFDEHDLTGWSAVVGHNWGAEHAVAWEWLHGVSGDDWFDQLRVRPFPRAPWLTLATTCLDGRRRQSRTPLAVSLALGPEVHWDYASPSGPPRQVRNCSVATAVLAGRTFFATVEHGG
jgi:hypothetical protein